MPVRIVRAVLRSHSALPKHLRVWAVVPATGFVPHFLVLAIVVVRNLSGGDCDTYYAHPNGSIGQMALEGLAFAVLGCAILPTIAGRATALFVASVAAWNAWYVILFYLALSVTNHWTWLHTFLIGGGLLTAAALIRHVAEER